MTDYNIPVPDLTLLVIMFALIALPYDRLDLTIMARERKN